MTNAVPQGPAAGPTPRAAYWALGLLASLNLLNYLDRFVVAPVLGELKRDMGLSDSQLGALPTAFILVYMLAAPVFGVLGDRGSRTRTIAAGIAVWSLATMVSGLAHGYSHLLASRAIVGIGEAALVAIAPALLADLFPPQGRARVFAVFNMAIPVGAALGYVVGGVVGEHFGWRAAFFVAGAPGLALALASLWLPDPPRGIQEGAKAVAAPAERSRGGALGLYWDLLRRRPFMVVVLGYAAYTFALGGLANWMVEFLVRVRHVPQGHAARDFGLVVLATGFLGTVAGGWLADALQKRIAHAYIWFSGVTTLLAAPLALLALTATAPAVYLPAIATAELLLFMSTGPVNAVIVNMVSPLERASAAALTMFVIHLLGDVPSPLLIGFLSDRLSAGPADPHGLAQAVLIVPGAVLAGGLIWLFAARGGATAER